MNIGKRNLQILLAKGVHIGFLKDFLGETETAALNICSVNPIYGFFGEQWL
jgi:hypothetical protein